MDTLFLRILATVAGAHFCFLASTAVEATTILEDGVPLNGSMAASSYANARFDVPADKTRITVTLSGQSGNLDLYLKHGSPVIGNTIPQIKASADVSSEESGPDEAIILTPTSSPPMRPGTWYVATLNPTATAIPLTLTATADYALSVQSGIGYPLEQPFWEIVSPSGGNAYWVRTDEGLRFDGSGLRQGTQIISRLGADVRGATMYMKWMPHGPTDHFATWGLGLGWKTDSGNLRAVAAAGKTTPQRGAAFSTVRPLAGGRVVNDDTWYYTRLNVGNNQVVTAVTATGDYDDQGGSVFHSQSYAIGPADWANMDNAFAFAVLDHNAGGTDARMTLGESRLVSNPATPPAPVISQEIDNQNIELTWTLPPGATGNYLHIGTPDEAGGIDLNGMIVTDVNATTAFSPNLPHGSTYYMLAQSYNAAGPGGVSEMVQVLTPPGIVTFPTAGSTIFTMRNAGPLRYAGFFGTPTPSGPDLPLRGFRVISGDANIRGVIDTTGQNIQVISGDDSWSINHNGDGTFDYTYFESGSPALSGNHVPIAGNSSSTQAAIDGDARERTSGVLDDPCDNKYAWDIKVNNGSYGERYRRLTSLKWPLIELMTGIIRSALQRTDKLTFEMEDKLDAIHDFMWLHIIWSFEAMEEDFLKKWQYTYSTYYAEHCTQPPSSGFPAKFVTHKARVSVLLYDKTGPNTTKQRCASEDKFSLAITIYEDGVALAEHNIRSIDDQCGIDLSSTLSEKVLGTHDNQRRHYEIGNRYQGNLLHISGGYSESSINGSGSRNIDQNTFSRYFFQFLDKDVTLVPLD